MAGRVTLWVALAALATFFFAMASRAGRDVLDDQQIPRLDKATEHFMCALWVGSAPLWVASSSLMCSSSSILSRLR